ncbi:MAG TPA: hypothetical protein VKB84_12745 [Candidatus Binataceae bacterium]|nr:hypothetical protein [Candidatus Binataceae bacterium]
MEPQPQQAASGDLRGRLAAIERAVDEGTYRPGPWQALLRDIRKSLFFERAALSDDVSRVSRKLHLRKPRRRTAMNRGLLLEILAVLIGGAVIILGVGARSSILAFLGALLWMLAFEPLIKVMVGRALGVHYDYFYLLWIEPRLKMRYGTFLTRPRLLRIIVHLAGTVGSPLAAWLTYWMLSQTLPVAAALCYGAFWVLVIVNLVNFLAPLFGVHRIGPMPLSMSSAGSAAMEIREGLGW